MNMTSNRPYLIRAMFDWIIENNLTPYLLVNADFPDVQIPKEYVKEGRIVLNISPMACRGLHLNNDRIVFTARFSGQAEQVVIFPTAVLAIYAKENGAGMEFAEDEGDRTPPPATVADSGAGSKKGKPRLTLVK